MNGRLRAFLRLYAVQGAWNYERMLGLGMGYAAEPLLDGLKRVDPRRHTEAVVRSAEFFNSHPYLAGVAVGASVRAEYDGVPGEQVSRLRTALCSPLGALGDQLFWVGFVPALAGGTLAAVTLGAGWWAVGAFLIVFNIIRARTGVWALATGLKAGMRVGPAISASLLPRVAAVAMSVAAFSVGLCIPLVGHWLLEPFGRGGLFGAVLGVVGAAASRVGGPRYTAPRFALVALVATLLICLVA